MRRVVITGLGIVAPSGIGKQEFWKNTVAGKPCVRKITRFDASQHPSQIAGEVIGFNPEEFVDKKQIRRTDRSTHYAIAASKLAVKDSGLILSQEDPERIGMVMGIAVGGIDFAESQFNVFSEKGLRGISPYTAIAIFCCAPIGQVAIDLGIKGYTNAVSTGCTSGTMAMINAYTSIKGGLSDIILAGGAEAPIAPLTIYSFCKINAISTKRNNEPERASRPFERDRDGFVMSEGSAVVIMEELEHAIRRNAHIYAELKGFGSSCNAFHMTAPEPSAEQSSRAMKQAIVSSGVSELDVDYIQAHGSSTPLNGKAETLAVKKTFGEHAYNIPMSSIKSMIGHPLGAAGAMQTVTSCLVIDKGIIPPTINYDVPDPDCDLDYVPNKARELRVDTVMQNSSGFSGVNATLLLTRYR